MSELDFRSAVDLRADIAARRVSPVDIVESLLERIKRIDPQLGSYCTVNEAAARAAAIEAEKAVRRNQLLGPLHGIPWSVKDLIATAGVRTTRGSPIFENYVPDFSSPAVERAQAAGAILLGKTSTSELGWKAVTDNSLFPPTRNPWDTKLTPGGSSGGAAASVAAGLGPLALATDAAGSTRIPAAFCGVFGLKPSFGRIPVYPAPAADSLVHVGVITRTVRDCALLLSVVAGPDERDRNTLPGDLSAVSHIAQGLGGVQFDVAHALKGVRVAWCPGFGNLPIEPEVLDTCASAVRQYQQAGLEVEEVKIDLPDVSQAIDTLFEGTFGAQVVDALPKWRERMDPGLVAMVEAGRRHTAYDLTKANMARSALWEAVRKFFERYEILLLPVAGTLPFPLGQDGPGQVAGVQTGSHAGPLGWLGFLYPFNLTGQPAASIPCGSTAGGLPVGLQIVGRRFQDATVLQVAAAFEQIRPWSHRTPACAT